jgi:hypothetical protein
MRIAGNRLATLIMTGLVLAMTGTAIAKDDLPDRTEDGLIRVESKKVDAVYRAEGATFDSYTKIMLVECAVAFKKDWMRDQNRSRSMGVSNRVDADDMERIKKTLSKEFDKQFTKVLEEGGYTIVQSPGHDVLLLRPAIVNLDVTAPDLQTASRSSSYTASAGQMTLYMELYDSATSSKIATVLDAQAARDSGFMMMSSSVTNRAEADKILRKWSGLLVDALDEAHESSE